MAAQRYKTTARLLQKELGEYANGLLPSIDELAARYRVSYQTMMKALHELRADGKVKLKSGRWTAAGTTAENPQRLAAPASAHGKLYDILKARIVEGAYETGHQLPKLDFFVINERVSKHTAHRAFALLARENLIHKRGKQWLAGPIPARQRHSPGAFRDDRPTVLLVFYSETWMKPFFDTFIFPFSSAFTSGLLENGFQPFLATQNVISMHDREIAKGFKQAQETIGRLGSRYQGSFVYSFANEGELDRWLPFLQSFSKPVVYFDSTDEGERFVRGNVGLKEKYYRLFFDEQSAIRTALDTLAGLGHTQIGMPDLTGKEGDWPLRRIRRARQCADSMSPRPNIVSAVHTEPFWDFNPSMHPDPFEQRIAKAVFHGRAGAVKNRDLLLRNTPSLASLIDKGITALLAVNDLAALEYLHWFREAGIRAPQDISLLSFDNIPDLMAYPLSSIDFGFRRLGYLAARIFIGDVPVSADKQGNIPGVCTLVDRGSIAACR
jgi:DNA-binding LacI/PurR family transcriptional regulator/DNA-binding transcriptional regulator YhcF (GntR family)